MLGGSTAPHRDIGLDCWSAQMPVENCLRRLKPNALIIAVQQLAQALYGAGDSSRSVALITSGTPGLPPGFALRPGSQCPRSLRSTLKLPLFCFSHRYRRHEYLTSSQAGRELASGWRGGLTPGLLPLSAPPRRRRDEQSCADCGAAFRRVAVGPHGFGGRATLPPRRGGQGGHSN